MNNQNQSMSQCDLMREIMEYCFAVYDVALYLDTHPDDQDALSMYHEFNDKYTALSDEYARKYGPPNMHQVTSDNYWTWVSDPWPWEGGMN